MSQLDFTPTDQNVQQPSAAAACAIDVTSHEMMPDHRPAGSVATELLVQIAAGLGHGDVVDLLPPGTGRRWALALETDSYEAWVIAWPAGTGLELHDHQGSEAIVHVVGGRLRERYVAADGSLAVRWLTAGDTVAMPDDHQHEVINLEADEAISVHVYSPRLVDQSFRETHALS